MAKAPLRWRADATAICILAFLVADAAFAQSSLPDPATTPGATNAAVTQANVSTTICIPGWTRTTRPPAAYTNALKRRQLQAEQGQDGARLADFEEDHLIPIELGGAPRDVRNLWPEPRHPRDGWTAERKDTLEDNLHRRFLRRQHGVADAQKAFAENWTAAYRQFAESALRRRRQAGRSRLPHSRGLQAWAPKPGIIIAPSTARWCTGQPWTA